MSNYSIGTTDNTLDATTYWDNRTTLREVITINDAENTGYVIRNKDHQPYDDWLMGLLVSFGVDKAFTAATWISLPVSKVIAAEGAGHITDHKLTDKAVRYLKIVELMNESK